MTKEEITRELREGSPYSVLRDKALEDGDIREYVMYSIGFYKEILDHLYRLKKVREDKSLKLEDSRIVRFW